MPRGVKGSGAGAAKGLELLNKTQVVGSRMTGLENSAEIKAIEAEEKAELESMDTSKSAEEMAQESFDEMQGDEGQLRYHPIGNGSTVPFPWDGENDESNSSCSLHVKDQNRGCNFAPICPLLTGGALHRKYDAPGGPYNIPYKDLRSGLVKEAFCNTFAKNYLHVPQIVILPGITKRPTRDADYKNLPNGQKPTPGPGQPRTPIEIRPRWTSMTCVPPAAMLKEYQRLRRSGHFLEDRKAKRRARRGAA